MRHVLGEKRGWVVTPFRLGVTTEGLAHNKYRSRCFGRGACFRRVGGCDIHAAFNSPTGLIYPAWDTGQLTVRTNTTVHQVLMDRTPARPGRGLRRHGDEAGLRGQGQGGGARGLHAGVDAHPAALEVARAPERALQFLGPPRTQSVRARARAARPRHLQGTASARRAANDDARPGGFYIPRFRNLDDKSKAKNFIRGYGLEGSSGQEMFPEDALKLRATGSAFKKKVRDHAGAFLYMYGLGEVLPRYENRVELDPQVTDAFGIPVLRFSYKYGDNEKKMCADMVTSMQEAFAASGFEITGSIAIR